MTASGEPTQAVLGFVRMLLRLVREETPAGVVVAFDRPTPTFRHEQYTGYKANRPPAPDELRVQVRRAHELLAAMGTAIEEVDGFEADDVLGTLSTQAKSAGFVPLVVTGDRDCLQLVDEVVRVLLTRKGIAELARMDEKAVEDVLGIRPAQLPDWKALVGDPSDNLPGVAGIGEKTAARLLQAYGNLEGIYDHLSELPSRFRSHLIDSREQAFRVRELATIRRDAPVRFDLKTIRFGPPDWPALDELLTRLEFRQVRQDLLHLFPLHARAGGAAEPGPVTLPAPDGFSPSPAGQEGRPSDAGRVAEPAAGTPPDTDTWLEDVDLARQHLARLRAAEAGPEVQAPGLPLLALAVVPGPGPKEAPRGLGLATAGGTLLLTTPVVRALRPELSSWLQDRHWLKVGFDLKRQAHALYRLDLRLEGPRFDNLIASYLLNPSVTPASPRELAAAHGLVTPGRAEGDEADAGAGPAAMSAQLRSTLAVQPVLASHLQAEGMEELFWEVEMPLVDVLAEMERTGVLVDSALLRSMSEEMGNEILRLSEQIYRLAGTEFNLNSPRQLADVLFTRLKLPVLKRTKTGPSTSADVLEELADRHEVVALILDHRQLVKLKTTYVDVLPSLIDPATGRLHTTFHQTVTATGRLSSSDPNLQNIPIRTEIGKGIRRAFIAPPGHVLLSADYSQIELRVLAHLAGDPALQEAFRSKVDIHTRTASEVFGVPIAEVTPAQRSAAKAINFGIIYGISGYGLARGTGLTREAAEQYIAAYFARYPGVKRYLDETVERARRDGYVTTLLGRRRYLPELRASNYAQRSFGQRMAMNTPIQGSAADIMKVAMVEVFRRLKANEYRTRLLLQVHDELLLEVPEGELAPVARLVKDAMEHSVELKVPLVVDLEVGPNWADTEPWTIEGEADA